MTKAEIKAAKKKFPRNNIYMHKNVGNYISLNTILQAVASIKKEHGEVEIDVSIEEEHYGDSSKYIDLSYIVKETDEEWEKRAIDSYILEQKDRELYERLKTRFEKPNDQNS